MRYLGTCDGNMQEGSLRADVNVSVRIKGSKEFGTRCEIKNVNSIKFMQMAIEYEANRQVDLIEEGKSIDQETRLFMSNGTRKSSGIERYHQKDSLEITRSAIYRECFDSSYGGNQGS